MTIKMKAFHTKENVVRYNDWQEIGFLPNYFRAELIQWRQKQEFKPEYIQNMKLSDIAADKISEINKPGQKPLLNFL